MNLIADTHVHSIVSGHAYSTISENIAAAKEKGLKFLAITDHAPALEGAPTKIYFKGMKALPEEVDGIRLLKGVELNIIDYNGTVDLPREVYKSLDWVIASLHTVCIEPATKKEHTRAWLKIAEDPDIDVIGHSGDPHYIFDFDEVIPVFARYKKIVEINTHSYKGRPGSWSNCTAIARLCAEHGVRIVVSSDAHFRNRVGDFEAAISMLQSINFPEELILNADAGRFADALR
jgi:putative hydrolase